MITTSNAFKECVRRSSRSFRARFLKDGEPIDCEIKKIVVRKGACAEKFSPGTVFASYINAEVLNIDVSIENEELLLQIGLLLDDGTVEYTNQGYYTVTKPKKSVYQTSFEAIGRISSKLNVLPDFPAEQTMAKLADAITSATGVVIIANGVNLAGTITKDLNGLTCREILEAMTSVLGGFATEDGDGRIVISKYSTASALEYNGDYTTSSPSFSEYNYTLSGIKVIAADGYTDEDGNAVAENSFTEGVPSLTLSNTYMTEELFGAFVQNTVGYSYNPGEITLALGDPRIEPWDCVSFTDADGTNHIVPCFELTHTYDGGLVTSICAKGESESESSLIIKGPVQKQVERLNADLFMAKDAIVKRLKADEILTDNIHAATGTFTKYLTGVRIIGDLIEAGTLKANTLILQGVDGIYRRLNIDSLGEAVVESDPKYNEKLDGSVLVAESVTADKIAANAITAEKINVDDLFAEDITATGDFALGKNGALSYDSKTGELSIKAKSLSIGLSEVATKTDMAAEIAGIEVGGKNLIRNSDDMIFEEYYFYEQGESTPVAVTWDNRGNVTLYGATATHDEEGNVSVAMKTLTVNGTTFEVVDQKARKDIEDIQANGLASSWVGTVTLYADKWVNRTSPYSQVVNIDGITENSQINLTPSVEQLEAFRVKDLAFVATNDGGVVTVYAVGQKPQNDYTIQITVIEVNYE